MTKVSVRTVRSPETKALISAKAKQRAIPASEELRARVRAMMKEIEREIETNDGIYPRDNGALSSAEVARRSNIHPTTLFSPKQRGLGKEVKAWIDALKEGKAAGVEQTRRSLATRISDWKQMYEGLAQAHRDTELELHELNVQIKELRSELLRLTTDNEQLRVQVERLGKSKVVPLRSTKA